MKILSKLLLAAILIMGVSAKNRLENEESYYLKMHANNPVNWYPWSEEAFERAKKENKLIFLSIGYSTCHWCHVMEKESFENPEIAKLLNRDYIAIKVDKEERPDIDKFYQQLYRVMRNRSGGWPLTMILTPNKRPLFAATYIPAEDIYKRSGLKSILPLIAKEYKKNPQKFEEVGEGILELAKAINRVSNKKEPISLDIINRVKLESSLVFDKEYGGFGKGAKFPQEALLNLLLDIYQLKEDKEILQMVDKTLLAMAKGGLFDHIEGGFFRYSTQRDYSIPHFEKMLYSNGNLIELYSRAYLITSKPLYKKIVKETIEFIDKRFFYNGLYFSASDADSNGKEGEYFLYDFKSVVDELVKRGFKKEEAIEELNNLSITADGNFRDELSHVILKGEVKEEIVEVLRDIR
ncbi:MAG: thioredoxin domain-containing protein, partial [Epsilonproteobacteria bacterium]|nr:thioredoxin domain-containing protein [Campylobacterota bacterium]